MSVYIDIDVTKRGNKKLYCECSQSYWVCSKNHARTMGEKWWNPFTSTLVITPMSWFFAQLFPSSGRFCVENQAELHEVRAARENLESMVLPTEFPTGNHISQTDAEVQGNLLRECERNFQKNRNWPNAAPMLVSRRTSRKDSSSLPLMMRHLTIWKWRNISSERVGSRKHEDRPSPGCENLLSLRTLRCGDHDRIFISRPNNFLGSHRERNQQIHDQNVRRNSHYKCWEQRYRETCRER